MPGISKIPENINKYAINWARKICREPIEFTKSVNYSNGKVLNDNFNLIKGNSTQCLINVKSNHPDILIHNHPNNTMLDFQDICTAIKAHAKKILASGVNGFTAMDFTTASKSDLEMLSWAHKANQETQKFVKEMIKKVKATKTGFSAYVEGYINTQEYLSKKLKEFADFSKATFENVEWTDLIK